MNDRHSLQFRDVKNAAVATRLASKRAQNHRTNEGERSERQNDVNDQRRRDRHGVTPSVSTWDVYSASAR